MKWWKGAFGLERDGLEAKSIIGLGGLAELNGASRQNGDNFRTNQVTLADYSDGILSHNPVGLAATWACVNLIAGTIASLPLMIYRTDAKGVRTIARDHTLYWLLHDSPNYDQTALDFWEFMCAGIELNGNAYALMDKASDGRLIALTPIRPDIVRVRRLADGQIEYRWAEFGRENIALQGDMLHIRGLAGPVGCISSNNLGGVSTLAVCRSAFASATSTENAARAMFGNGARPSGVLATDKTLTPDQRKLAEQLLQEKFVGAMNAGRPMLLDNGVSWTQLTISPEDAQMLDSRKFSGEEICRIFGVPPAMVGYGDKASNWGTGKEVDVLGFQKFTLRRRLKRIEQALQKQLLTPADRKDGITIEFNIEGLLRGDSAARSAFYQAALGDTQKPGWMVRNEVRALENLPPVEGWDDPIPLISQRETISVADPGATTPPA